MSIVLRIINGHIKFLLYCIFVFLIINVNQKLVIELGCIDESD